jgi:putative methionine-R-sulfoxide reductase with GAF domain
MSGGLLDELTGLLEREGEADDALRTMVAALAGLPGVVWAGIAFLEDGQLVLGPSAGEQEETRRTRVPISFGGNPVGELQVDGEADRAVLEKAADLVSPYVLIGWDTGGEAWEP